jgi:peptide/nickel transport system permease protein
MIASSHSARSPRRLLVFAIQRRDLELVQATTLLIVIIYCLANLFADVIYAYLNPRIRYN